MKIQNMAVVFIIIILPISILLSVYVKGEVEVIKRQNKYDQILSESTYDAVKAFKLNTVNNSRSTQADSIRRDIKASINSFINSLVTNLGVSGYGTESIKPYIPAIVYTLYDGFYIYSPTINLETGVYEHIIKPYIYYSIRYRIDNYNDVVINYTLDNYIVVYGIVNGNYVSRAGYLENVTDISINGSQVTYKGTVITDETAKQYYIEAREFTQWINDNLAEKITPSNARKIGENDETYPEFEGNVTDRILNITGSNDPQREDSAFNVHRREVIRLILQDNLNSAITSYSANSEALGTTYNFKMPILEEEEWNRLIENVTMITFMQGLPIGNKYYNGYSVVSCPKNKEYISVDSIYYINEGDSYYHRIDCPEIVNENTLVGYKNIEFERKINSNLGEENKEYIYEHEENACYYCIINSNYESQPLTSARIQAQYNAMGRIRKELYKRGDDLNKD